MEKIKKFVFPIILLTFACVIAIIGIIQNNKTLKIIESIKNYVLESEENIMLYIGSSSCEACKYEIGQFSILLNEFNFEYYYIDLDEIKKTSFKNRILTELDLDIKNGVDLPSLIVYKDGKIVDKLTGLSNADSIFNFLNKNGIIKDEKLPVNYLDFSGYKSHIEKSGIKILAFVEMASFDGVDFQTKLWEIASDSNIEIDFLVLDELADSEREVIINSNELFSETFFDEPVLIVNDGNKLVDYVTGNQESDVYLEFFKNLDIINE